MYYYESCISIIIKSIKLFLWMMKSLYVLFYIYCERKKICIFYLCACVCVSVQSRIGQILPAGSSIQLQVLPLSNFVFNPIYPNCWKPSPPLSPFVTLSYLLYIAGGKCVETLQQNYDWKLSSLQFIQRQISNPEREKYSSKHDWTYQS